MEHAHICTAATKKFIPSPRKSNSNQLLGTNQTAEITRRKIYFNYLNLNKDYLGYGD
jgi:hypothetical protein